jgi:hypothetical protein
MEFEKYPQTRGSHQAPTPHEPGEGCLITLIRIAVRIVVLLVVVPVRMLWDLLVVCGRAVDHVLLRPLGRALTWVYERVLTPLGHALAWLATVVGKSLFVWPWVGLWRYLVVPVVMYGLVVPLVWSYQQLLIPLGHGLAWLVENLLVAPVSWMYRRLLTPVGHGIAAVLAWLGKALFVWPWVALWRYVMVPVVTYGLVVPLVWIYRQLLTPLGHGIAWLLTGIGHGLAAVCRGLWAVVAWLVVTLLVTPVVWVYRHLLAPVGREIAGAIGVAWRIAGYISRAVGRALVWLARNLVGRPLRWLYQGVCTPVGHLVRDAVWRPAKKAAVDTGRAVGSALRSVGETVRAARETVRAARAVVWPSRREFPSRRRADPPRAQAGEDPAPEPRGPVVPQARRLGDTQYTQQTRTVPGVAAEPEISLRKQG